MITNYLSPLEFIVTVKRMPHVQFYTQRASIPSVALQPIEKPTPFKRLYEPGDSVVYGELNLSFIVDEDMNNYLEVLSWMKGLTSPDEFDQYRSLETSESGIKSDISLVVKNSHKNPSIIIDYKDCFPLQMSDVQLDTTQNDIVYPEVTVTFQYNSFEISKAS